MSLSALYYHLVIRTQNGKKTLPELTTILAHQVAKDK